MLNDFKRMTIKIGNLVKNFDAPVQLFVDSERSINLEIGWQRGSNFAVHFRADK